MPMFGLDEDTWQQLCARFGLDPDDYEEDTLQSRLVHREYIFEPGELDPLDNLSAPLAAHRGQRCVIEEVWWKVMEVVFVTVRFADGYRDEITLDWLR